ncbi:pyridoxamine 5'-phosphate oxidase family protein [Flectobacillus major]|jgi:predicted pyridoxine 5'-phosphate oxidase superfamily flavin-nucleotide-binding protein|uniref:pyridoxamine 5'-phosphate oxidase family protein n=1 Tax=Flectobacillus major TaxID=103 RepID=UPI0004083542|nr:pyridoxamine 5'-phosphate oxidase family protein [Flectobacillus major]
MNYYNIAFSDASKKLQERFGSRNTYSKAEKFGVKEGLSDNEIRFIEERDSFYMATIGTNGFPYIQHRGGPTGFVKVIDDKTIAFLDFAGNRQFVSVGNMLSNDKVALIMVSYPHRARIKLYAKARIEELDANPALTEQLQLDNYKSRPERIIILDIEAFDWNCPQHITPRYTLAEIEESINGDLDI